MKLLTVKDEKARHFYEEEALRGGWSVRQLDRQIGSLFYDLTLLSKNKAAILRKGRRGCWSRWRKIYVACCRLSRTLTGNRPGRCRVRSGFTGKFFRRPATSVPVPCIGE